MLFDWAEYLALARRLAEEDTEACRRSAISRAYYSVYHAARLFLAESEGFQLSADSTAHAQVWNQFNRSGRTYQGVRVSGDRLRKYRGQADYDAEIERLSELPEDSFNQATKILSYLDQLKKAQLRN